MAAFGWLAGVSTANLQTYYSQLEAQVFGNSGKAGMAIRAASSGDVSIERESVTNPTELMEAIAVELGSRGVAGFVQKRITRTSIRYV